MEPGFLGLATKLTHAESGQWQSSLAVVPLPKNDPQGMGIAMTYCCRYVLSAMLGLVTEEDTDGEMEAPKRKAPSKSSEPSLPRLDGVTYEKTRGTDGKEYCIARGGTAAKKDLLIGAGFRWSAERKFWWRPAYAI